MGLFVQSTPYTCMLLHLTLAQDDERKKEKEISYVPRFVVDNQPGCFPRY